MSTDPIARLLGSPPDLPVAGGLEALVTALRSGGSAVLQSPPGSGKTTLVPPAVADLVGPGARVIVTQPRRIAARAAARRLADLLGEPVGRTVGYAVRGDRQIGASTRIEFVTTGLLLRRIQRDPDLPGVAAVVLDEVHERQLDSDLTLALLVDVRGALREDLVLVAMSATIEAERTAMALGGGAGGVPVIDVPGALHPVAQRWAPLPAGVKRMDERGVTPRFLDHVAATAADALHRETGDLLVFCPGVAEVDGVVRRLSRLAGGGVEVQPLHGRLPAAQQDRTLALGERGRVVVSTAVAESSLTVPGVRTVVDAGLSREPRTDHRRGLAGLVTVRVSRASAEQRGGRAGREGPGSVYRCWSEAEHAHLDAHPAPEIATADLTAFALELALWGSPDGADLSLLDPPPEVAMRIAAETLRDLGAVDAAGVLTPRGRLMAATPVDPRLARGLLDGAGLVGAARAAEIVALLAEDIRSPGADLVAALRSQRQGRTPDAARWKSTRDRLRKALPNAAAGATDDLTDDLAVGAVVAHVHPDRIARRRPGGTSYLMVGGTGAVLPRGESGLAGIEWLAVGDVDRRAGASEALIRSAAPLDEDLAQEAASARWSEGEEVRWKQGRVVARRVTRLGAIELASTTLASPDPLLVAGAVREGLRREGLAVLPWKETSTTLRQRMAFLRRALGDPWPAVDDEALLSDIDGWLGSELGNIRGTSDLRRIDVLSALRRLLPWPQAGRFDELAPERVVVPSGSSVRVDYEPEQPVLAVKLQEAFGWSQTPRLADGRVPLLLHLLSPARRPLAVTADLASFWDSAYPAVRAEMRGRYPRHPWPEDPWTAPAQRGVNKRS
ncbi:ATP-dependent helicase HrpB [Nocardioides salsibiostraticola]